jgi:hypothetical protein
LNEFACRLVNMLTERGIPICSGASGIITCLTVITEAGESLNQETQVVASGVIEQWLERMHERVVRAS